MDKLRVGINPVDKDWVLTCVEFCIYPSSIDGMVIIKLETTGAYFMLNKEKYKTWWWNQQPKMTQEDERTYDYIASNNKALLSTQTQFFLNFFKECISYNIDWYNNRVVVYTLDALFFLQVLFYKYGFYIIYSMDYTAHSQFEGVSRIIGRRHNDDEEFLKRKIPLYKSLHECYQRYKSNVERRIILLLRSNRLPKELLPLVCVVIWLRPFRSMEYNNFLPV